MYSSLFGTEFVLNDQDDHLIELTPIRFFRFFGGEIRFFSQCRTQRRTTLMRF
jgi:hypothetical protein